jgi:hypothetical protein
LWRIRSERQEFGDALAARGETIEFLAAFVAFADYRDELEGTKIAQGANHGVETDRTALDEGSTDARRGLIANSREIQQDESAHSGAYDTRIALPIDRVNVRSPSGTPEIHFPGKLHGIEAGNESAPLHLPEDEPDISQLDARSDFLCSATNLTWRHRSSQYLSDCRSLPPAFQPIAVTLQLHHASGVTQELIKLVVNQCGNATGSNLRLVSSCAKILPCAGDSRWQPT